jgi:hypothetical protein
LLIGEELLQVVDIEDLGGHEFLEDDGVHGGLVRLLAARHKHGHATRREREPDS